MCTYNVVIIEVVILSELVVVAQSLVVYVNFLCMNDSAYLIIDRYILFSLPLMPYAYPLHCIHSTALNP